MNKAHSRINWENRPSDATPLNASNLNKLDVAINEIDNRVVAMDTTKLDKTTAMSMVKNVTFDETTGVFTITYLNGVAINLDTKLEKLAVNFSWDAETQALKIILDDGTVQTVDLSKLITVYEFLESDTIAFSVDNTGKVSAIVKEGSIEEKHLQPNYLADVKTEVAKAETGAQNAESSALMSESFTRGGTGLRENEETDNAMYYFLQAKDISKGMNGLIPMGTITFAELSNEDNQGDKFMFNISENFTTDDTFREGAGHEYPAGVNVYRTSDGFWDCLAGNFVAGVKGAKEATYREGFVELTAEDVGALPEDGDSKENIVAFESADESSPTAWTSMELFKSGEKHSSLFNKVSIAIKNLRYLYKMLGTTDISTIGDGTVKGAIASQNETFTKSIDSINTNLSNILKWKKSDTEVVGSRYYGGYNSYMQELGVSELMFIVYDGYYSYSFVFPLFPNRVLRKSDFTNDDLKDYITVSYNEWGQNGTGDFSITHLYRDGVEVEDSNITIRLYYR